MPGDERIDPHYSKALRDIIKIVGERRTIAEVRRIAAAMRRDYSTEQTRRTVVDNRRNRTT